MKPRAHPSCLVLGAACFSAAPALAAESSIGFDLVWEAPPECPQRDDVARQIVDLLGRGPTDLPDFHVRGGVARTATGTYALVLDTVRAAHRGNRSMEDESCAELTSAGAAVIALAIDPEFQKRVGAPPEATTPATPPAVVQPQVEEPPPPPEPREPREPPPRTITEQADTGTTAPRNDSPQRGIEALLGAAVAADVGTLPGFSPGPALSLAARSGWALVGLTGLWLPKRRRYISGSSIGGDFDFLGLELMACADPWNRPWTLAGCAGFGFGRVRGSGTGATSNAAASVTWATAHAGVLFRLPIWETLLADAAAELVIPLQRATFVVENSGLVYEPEPVSGRARLGLAWRFW